MENLPPEIQRIILGHINKNQRRSVARVCKMWDYLYKTFRYFPVIVFENDTSKQKRSKINYLDLDIDTHDQSIVSSLLSIDVPFKLDLLKSNRKIYYYYRGINGNGKHIYEFWNMYTRKCLNVIYCQSKSICSVCVSNNLQIMCVKHKNILDGSHKCNYHFEVYHLESFQLIHELELDIPCNMKSTYSSIILGYQHEKKYIIKVLSLNCIQKEFDSHNYSVITDYIVIGSKIGLIYGYDNYIKIWDIEKDIIQTITLELNTNQNNIRKYFISPCLRKIACIISYPNGYFNDLAVWSINNENNVENYQKENNVCKYEFSLLFYKENLSNIRKLKWSPNCIRILLHDYQSIKIYNMNGKLTFVYYLSYPFQRIKYTLYDNRIIINTNFPYNTLIDNCNVTIFSFGPKKKSKKVFENRCYSVIVHKDITLAHTKNNIIVYDTYSFK